MDNSSKYKVINYINENYDIRSLYENVTGRVPGHAKIYCPFHHNIDTPAAKIYGNNLKCFGECNRLFGPYDFLKKFFPEEIEKVKRSVILPNVSQKKVDKASYLSRKDINITQPIEKIIEKVLEYDTDKI